MEHYPRNYWGQDSPDTVWVEITPKRITFQNSKDQRSKGGIQSILDPENPPMRFLLQEEFALTQNHTWEPFDTVEGQLMEVSSKVSTGVRAAVNPRGHGSRADMPVTYTDSERRSYTFDFELASQGDNYNDVFLPTQKLLELAAAEPTGAVNLRFPNVFGIRTVTGQNAEVGIVKVEHAALTSVQPAWRAPYVGGYPTSCKLTLTLTDLSPLFRSSYTVGFGKITVGG